jgi:hypothetical protein
VKHLTSLNSYTNFNVEYLKSMNLTENFRLALEDYIFLLDKKYPEKSIHELISTRYSLSHFERSMLYRGITTNEKANKRIIKQVSIVQLNNAIMHIDLFNVLYTIAAYLRGFPVFISNDTLLRDASESHGSGEWEVHLEKSLDLLIKSLAGLKIKKAVIYVDNPLEHSKVISEKLEQILIGSKPLIETIYDASPDHLIREATDGIIATSDSTIIDKSALQVFDLPRHILESSFNRPLLNLADI